MMQWRDTAGGLERDIVVDRRLITAHAHLFSGTGVHLLRQPGAAPAAEKLNPLRDDLSDVAFVAALVVVGASADAALDINLPALGQILAAGLGLLAPDDDVVPLGSFLPFAVPVVPLLGSGDGKIRHRAARLRVANFGIFAEIAHQDDFVDRHLILHAAGA